MPTPQLSHNVGGQSPPVTSQTPFHAPPAIHPTAPHTLPPPVIVKVVSWQHRREATQLVPPPRRLGNRCQQPCQLWGRAGLTDVNSVESTVG